MRKAFFLAAAMGLLSCRSHLGAASTTDLTKTIYSRKAKTSCYKKTSPNLRLSGEYYRLLDSRLEQLAGTADTLFIIESFNVEFGSISNSLLTRTGRLDFVAYQGTVEVQDSLFEIPLYALVLKWDLAAIKALAAKNKLDHDARQMRIYRLYLRGKKKAECLHFQQFHF